MKNSGEFTKWPLQKHPYALCIALFGMVIASMAAGAAIGMNWTKSEVIPVVLVKPGIGGFVPMEGTSIGNTWSKETVKPVLLVKPGIGGFEPVEGVSIGNYWSKNDVIPVVLTEPGINGFSAMDFSDATDDGSKSATPSASIIESQIDGDFNGWEGETIIRLTNGQIWKQSSYHYEYHYAFMPKVLIYKSGGAYKIKVDGTETSVSVTRLK
jgi:hypothetical protein